MSQPGVKRAARIYESQRDSATKGCEKRATLGLRRKKQQPQRGSGHAPSVHQSQKHVGNPSVRWGERPREPLHYRVFPGSGSRGRSPHRPSLTDYPRWGFALLMVVPVTAFLGLGEGACDFDLGLRSRTRFSPGCPRTGLQPSKPVEHNGRTGGILHSIISPKTAKHQKTLLETPKGARLGSALSSTELFVAA